MTIKIEHEVAQNIFESNSVFNLSQANFAKFPQSCEIKKAAGKWLVVSQNQHICAKNWYAVTNSSDPVFKVGAIIFKHVTQYFASYLPSYEAWFFVSEATWKLDTKLARYFRLWKNLNKQHEINIPENSLEMMHEQDGKLRFSGAIKMNILPTESLVKLLLEESSACIVLLPKNSVPEKLLNTLWSGNTWEDSEFIGNIVNLNGVLVKKHGEPGGNQLGFIAFASLDALLKGGW
jgi:hypothetical protein